MTDNIKTINDIVSTYSTEIYKEKERERFI